MDREISKKEQQKQKIKTALKIAVPAVLVVVALTILLPQMAPTMRRESLTFAKVDRGTVETSADASGKVVPAYEMTITSPVATKILEIYCHEGDMVEPGESLMKLDLMSEETELQNLSDQRLMKSYDTEQTILASRTYLTNLEMQIKAKEMSVARLKTEMANEKHLDSIGSGTGDRVREAELAYKTSLLELDQLRKQLQNETLSHEASRKTKVLEEGIMAKNLEEKRRTLEDARVKAPAKATVTYLNSNIGTSISPGERLAILSDLSHFKIAGQIAESNTDKLSLGAEVKVRIGKDTFTGKIGTITPQSNNGVVAFTVILDNDNDEKLRSGVRAEINVLYDIKEGVIRIPNGNFYHGPGKYIIFVETADNELEQREVMLGDANFDYIEVLSGLNPGETFVKSDLSEYASKKQ
ncbi:MAG: efflux RND transporter periplasmic adaptor subunit, partial [Muribaculaceae bacterium]|nr:efflux RND transporter periplasmic adaptor subunit [Muribaculaceae bacterium]